MNKPQRKSPEEELLFNRLKEILLAEDRRKTEELRELLEDPILFSERVSPIIDRRIRLLKEHFPAEFGAIINETIDRRLLESQEKILEVIYPVLGRMIVKYIEQQFTLLRENIENRLNQTFSSRTVFGRLKGWMFGIKESDQLLSDMDVPVVHQAYVIEHNSGILKGNCSRKNVMDQDLIAGMLTAIKSFVEDAFHQEQSELEMIQYRNYKIIIQNFHNYYIALVLSGSLTTQDEYKISKKLLTFAEKELNSPSIDPEEVSEYDYISGKLEEYFSGNLLEE